MLAHENNRSVAARFSAALVLTSHSGEGALDKNTLRAQGIRHVQVMDSGIAAARLLARQAVRSKAGEQQSRTHAKVPARFDVILCADTLDDMSGADFARIIGTHPLLSGIPVILVAKKATRKDVVRAIECGCSGYMLRPYTIDALEKQLVRAVEIARSPDELAATLQSGKLRNGLRQFDKALNAFEEVIEQAVPKADELYSQGSACLQQRDWDGAIRAFNTAIRHNVLYAEAYMGLSSAWRGKGDPAKAQKYMKMAGEAYIRLRAFEKACAIFSKVQKEFPQGQSSGQSSGKSSGQLSESIGKNPLYAAGSALVKQGRYKEAAQAYLYGNKLTPEDNCQQHVARACHFTDNPETAASALCREMEKLGAVEQARRLYRRIVDMPEREPQKKERHGWLANFPLLHDVVTVASYTLRSYKRLETTESKA